MVRYLVVDAVAANTACNPESLRSKPCGLPGSRRIRMTRRHAAGPAAWQPAGRVPSTASSGRQIDPAGDVLPVATTKADAPSRDASTSVSPPEELTPAATGCTAGAPLTTLARLSVPLPASAMTAVDRLGRKAIPEEGDAAQASSERYRVGEHIDLAGRGQNRQQLSIVADGHLFHARRIAESTSRPRGRRIESGQNLNDSTGGQQPGGPSRG